MKPLIVFLAPALFSTHLCGQKSKFIKGEIGENDGVKGFYMGYRWRKCLFMGLDWRKHGKCSIHEKLVLI